jgi:hypothetical protein
MQTRLSPMPTGNVPVAVRKRLRAQRRTYLELDRQLAREQARIMRAQARLADRAQTHEWARRVCRRRIADLDARLEEWS